MFRGWWSRGSQCTLHVLGLEGLRHIYRPTLGIRRVWKLSYLLRLCIISFCRCSGTDKDGERPSAQVISPIEFAVYDLCRTRLSGSHVPSIKIKF